jgi:hypothetical protein
LHLLKYNSKCIYFPDKVKFDNSYSWMNSKLLSYSIEVVNMDEIPTDTESVISCTSLSSNSESFQDSSSAVQPSLWWCTWSYLWLFHYYSYIHVHVTLRLQVYYCCVWMVLRLWCPQWTFSIISCHVIHWNKQTMVWQWNVYKWTECCENNFHMIYWLTKDVKNDGCKTIDWCMGNNVFLGDLYLERENVECVL